MLEFLYLRGSSIFRLSYNEIKQKITTTIRMIGRYAHFELQPYNQWDLAIALTLYSTLLTNETIQLNKKLSSAHLNSNHVPTYLLVHTFYGSQLLPF